MPFPFLATSAAAGGGGFLGALGGAEGLSSILGAAGGLIGGNSALDAQKKFKKHVKNTYAKAQAFSDYGFMQQQQVLDAQEQGVKGAYKKAIAQSQFAAQQGKVGTMQQGQATLGSALGGMESAGLGGSTLAANAKAGIGAMTSKALADIDALTAQVTGGLGLEQQSALGQIMSMKGNLAAAKAGANTDLLFGKMGALQGVPSPGNLPQWMLGAPEMAQTDWGGIGKAIGSVDWGSLFK